MVIVTMTCYLLLSPLLKTAGLSGQDWQPATLESPSGRSRYRQVLELSADKIVDANLTPSMHWQTSPQYEFCHLVCL